MTNHTPGPWNVHGDDKTLIGASDGKMMLAQTMYRHVVPEWERNLAEAQANAHLIAAAPALREALQGMMAWAGELEELTRAAYKWTEEDERLSDEAFRKARVALAHADGREYGTVERNKDA